MGQRRFWELIEKALTPMPLGDFCFPVRWALAVAMVSIASGAFVAVALLRSTTNEKMFCIAIMLCAVVSIVAIELVVRSICAYRDVEIKKLDVLKAEIDRAHEKSERDHEDFVCANAPREHFAEPEGRAERVK